MTFEVSNTRSEFMAGKNQGEGNRDADRRYREGVQKTVKETSEKERADEAREISKDDLKEAERAEEKGKERARH
jgi:hypothetical protein